MVGTNTVLRRLAALEAAIAPPSSPTLINVWTRSLAERIEKVLPRDRDYRLVNLTFSDEATEAQFEKDLRKDNPKEAAKLDALLRGEIPTE